MSGKLIDRKTSKEKSNFSTKQKKKKRSKQKHENTRARRELHIMPKPCKREPRNK